MDIKYTFSTMISVDYYLAHPDMYEKDRNWVLMLNQYLKKHTDALLTPESLNEVYFGYGNNVWFRIVRNNVAKIAIAFVVIILGIILAITSKIMQRISASAEAGFFLGLFMVDFATWIFSESELRQLIFQRPSMSQYFAYWAMELFAPPPAAPDRCAYPGPAPPRQGRTAAGRGSGRTGPNQ